MRFLNYNEYMSIVLSTNDIFDFWFFQKKLDCNPAIFSTKKEITKMPINQQTKEIIDLLKNQNASDSMIELFTKRKKIESIIFDRGERRSSELSCQIEELTSQIQNLKKAS